MSSVPPMSVGGPFVREALPSDAVAVRRLLVDNLGSFALPFTIYRSPLSEAFLSHRFHESRSRVDERFVVLFQGETVCGFAASRMFREVGFLDYIAVSTVFRGRGLGSLLLDSHHDWSLARSATSTSLDVFETNAHATRWYRSRGYRDFGLSFSYRLSSHELDVQGPDLEISDDELAEALGQEDRFGVCRLSCTLGGRPILLGLFGRCACRVLDFGGSAPRLVIGAVARRFRGSRPEIVVVGAAEPWSFPGLLGQERVCRLRRVEQSRRW